MQNKKIAELLAQYFELGVAEGREGRNHDTEAGDAQRVLSEIESEIAALSAAAPVMFISEKQLGYIGQYLPTRKEAEGNFQLALYRTPPAPSVTVKALGWRKYGNQHGHGWQGMGAIGYLQYIVYRGPEGEEGWFWADRGFDKEDEAKAAVQAHYESCIRSALSARAQDLAI